MRFVLTGSFHGLNRGDSGMQLAAAAELRARRPDHRSSVTAEGSATAAKMPA